MNDVEVEVLAEPELAEPVLVEGLPGVGHVGTLVAEHLIEEGEGELVGRIYSEHLPPQVSVSESGLAELVCVECHHVVLGDRDLLVVTGDQQAASGVGHYRIAEAVLDVATDFGVETVLALGGVPTGELVEDHAVLGAAANESLIETLESSGVEFRENEPEGGIVGISGLLVGLGRRRDLDAACLMGETSGYLVDPKSAQALLAVLQDLLDFEVDLTELEERADEMEEVVERMEEIENQNVPTEDDLRYIG
ncbi:proteasome assembly chaperone family protein [Halalkalicoccus sp. NIPERK01]|uniref:proteasome assembly chaperone family protein n=1 Tax=Halalkalicoccus sp. NIPERK01 TaxID=3053469 RepID=UPI00256EC1BF|nr:proteasome assembly chaperone family protein [Halalkalicoccus sp. NIPERK01]MDL5363767.1 proteasome assembly chaperone family protein [Halalkalicoccus sp. NIPERK01]